MNKKVLFFMVFCLISLLSLFIYQDREINDGKLHIVFCDVGQGDGIYIRTSDGSDIVIDGGPDNSILLCLTNNMPFWDRTIELMILTHPDADHYTGLIPIARQYNVLSFATSFTQKDVPGYQTLFEILTAQQTQQRFVCQGDKFSFPDELKIEIVWPRSCSLGSTEKNDNSVVAVFDYKDLEVLLTGDAEENIGDFYQDRVGDIDILKVPHHGSKDGVDKDYLSAIEPEVAVLSVGGKNRYGHPTRPILDLLSDSKVTILRTDKDGDVMIKSDGDTYTISSSKN